VFWVPKKWVYSFALMSSMKLMKTGRNKSKYLCYSKFQDYSAFWLYKNEDFLTSYFNEYLGVLRAWHCLKKVLLKTFWNDYQWIDLLEWEIESYRFWAFFLPRLEKTRKGELVRLPFLSLPFTLKKGQKSFLTLLLKNQTRHDLLRVFLGLS